MRTICRMIVRCSSGLCSVLYRSVLFCFLNVLIELFCLCCLCILSGGLFLYLLFFALICRLFLIPYLTTSSTIILQRHDTKHIVLYMSRTSRLFVLSIIVRSKECLFAPTIIIIIR